MYQMKTPQKFWKHKILNYWIWYNGRLRIQNVDWTKFINTLAITALIIIWGVQAKDIIIAFSSIVTVVGVAMFAQWSILSNITSGVILFFSFPFKIGDIIKIHDKDFPIEAEIVNIGAFHVFLKTDDGEQIIYPNNLLLQKGISILKNHFKNNEFVD